MKIIFKNLLPYWKSVGIILILLILQAFADLALPQYTSDIIDTGILNSGVESIIPEALTQEELSTASLFMTEEETALWNSCFTQEDGIFVRINDSKTIEQAENELLLPVLINYQMSAVTEETFKQLLSSQGEETEAFRDMSIEQIGDALGITLSVFEREQEVNGETVLTRCTDIRPLFFRLSEIGKFDSGAVEELRSQIQASIDKMGTSFVTSMGIAYARACDEAAGLNLEHLQTRYLIKASLKMLLMALIIVVDSILIGYLASRVGAGMGKNLRERVFSRVMQFSNTEMDQFSTASLITRCTNDVQQVQFVSVMLLRMLAYAPILGLGGVFKVMKTGSGMEWVIALALIVISAFVFSLMSVAMPKFKRMQKLVDRVNLVSREILTGLSVIRAFGRESHEEARFDSANRELTKTNLFTNRIMSVMMPGMTIIMNGISVLIIWVAAHRIDTGVMQVGTMTAFITYSMQIIMSFLMLTMMSIMLPRAGVAAERIDEVLRTDSSILDPEHPEDSSKEKGTVTFSHVSFRYADAEEDTLKDITFTARPGQTTAIIGSTGSGKSALINLIPRLYDVTEGAVTVGGVDVRKQSLQELRSKIGMVPQKAVLFSGTIASNICYCSNDLSEKDMKKAASVAQASDFIEEKEKGYDSPIAQGGTNVSGGQKQRLSIARAIAKNPDIYIFDDSFSALDLKTDAALRRSLGELVKDRTVIIVAQRISTILSADQILVLDEGRLVGKGTHQELMESCETYQQIARSQLSEKELNFRMENHPSGKEEKING